jgi:hypothetical protein
MECLGICGPCHADAETASLRENQLSRHPRVCPRRAFSPSLGPPAEGRAPHAREDDTGLTEACVLLATGSWSTHRLQMECLGIRGASQFGRTECVPPRKPPFAPSPGFPSEATSLWIASPGGAGSARPRERYWLHPGISPPGCRAIVNGCGGNEMSRSTCSLATRTHRVRPSEKTAFRVIPGFAPGGPSRLRLAISRRGGLRTPAREARA